MGNNSNKQEAKTKKQKKDKNYKIEILKSSSIIHDTYFILVDIDREKYEGLILSTEEEV